MWRPFAPLTANLPTPSRIPPVIIGTFITFAVGLRVGIAILVFAAKLTPITVIGVTETAARIGVERFARP